jgi:hypothetical protein
MLARLGSFVSPPGWLTAATPTADIYFLNALRDEVAAGTVQALGPNVYGAGGRYVVLRYANDRELALLEAARPRQIFYVIDDDLEALPGGAIDGSVMVGMTMSMYGRREKRPYLASS